MKKTKFTLICQLLALTWLTSCSSLQPQRQLAQLPESSLHGKNWTAILQQASLIDSFKILQTGEVAVPKKGMLNEKKMADKPEFDGDESMWVDVYAFLFHHKNKGWFLIDTGLDSSFRKGGNIKGFFAGNYIRESKLGPDESIGAQLKRENKEIQGIYFTHLHGDHTAGLPEIADSIPKFAGKGDEYHALPFFYLSNHLDREDVINELDVSKGMTIAPFESVIDIFGDGSFLGMHTPGHSKGHMSYFLNWEKQPVLLTGDASHTQYGFERGIEPGWADDRAAAESSLDQLKAFAQEHENLRICYGHEGIN